MIDLMGLVEWEEVELLTTRAPSPACSPSNHFATSLMSDTAAEDTPLQQQEEPVVFGGQLPGDAMDGVEEEEEAQVSQSGRDEVQYVPVDSGGSRLSCIEL